MKKDQYIPHEVSMRTTSEVMKLIEEEGMTGYGIYWALMEYLRVQDNYVGDIGAMKYLSRQLKTSIDRLMRILKNYGLFEVADFTFQSRKLNSVMKPLEDKRKAMDKQLSDDRCMTVQRKARNPLKTNADISLSKVKESKEENTPSKSSSSAEAAAGKKEVLPKSFVPAWEQYVDSLQQEEQWKELMAMRTGLKKDFYKFFPRIVENFKQHVRLLGNEGRILSPSDAKHYFCFYLDPGSVTFKKLWEELHKPIEKGKYQYEDRDPATGQRSYCGVPIPADAPPRPNAQAVWCDGKWVF